MRHLLTILLLLNLPINSVWSQRDSSAPTTRGKINPMAGRVFLRTEVAASYWRSRTDDIQIELSFTPYRAQWTVFQLTASGGWYSPTLPKITQSTPPGAFASTRFVGYQMLLGLGVQQLLLGGDFAVVGHAGRKIISFDGRTQLGTYVAITEYSDFVSFVSAQYNRVIMGGPLFLKAAVYYQFSNFRYNGQVDRISASVGVGIPI